jgi:signal transduction histidine kinase
VNIFSNAVRHSPGNGRIKIILSDAKKFLLCQISNQGEAIPESELELIFDKFEQSTQSKKSSGGTGLGLAISREIIRAHGGNIWAENSKDGSITFSFILPREKR